MYIDILSVALTFLFWFTINAVREEMEERENLTNVESGRDDKDELQAVN